MSKLQLILDCCINLIKPHSLSDSLNYTAFDRRNILCFALFVGIEFIL